MTEKKKPHTAGTGTASNPTPKNLDSSAQDPAKGWYSLGQTVIDKTLEAAKTNPVFPSLGTQPARLLVALLQHRKIHPLAGWQALGIYRLSDTVLQLRKMGWPVITGRLDVNNRFGEPCHVALYSLPQEVIYSVGNKGVEYITEAERQAA